MKLRRYKSSDSEVLIAIYRDAILVTGAEEYDAAQIEAWVGMLNSVETLRARLNRGLCLVAETEDGNSVGFGQLDPLDHIAFLYTSSRYNRQGIASAIYQKLEARAVSAGVKALRTEASRIAKRFFLKKGFTVQKVDEVERNGVILERFLMEKPTANISLQRTRSDVGEFSAAKCPRR